MTSKERVCIRRKWQHWLHEIGDDLGWLLTSHDVFMAVQEAFRENKNIQRPTLVYRWIKSNYAARISIGIRRLIDHDKRTISLHRLIQDISDHPDAITRQYFVGKCTLGSRREERPDKADLANCDYDRFAKKGSKMVSKRKLSRDLSRLKQDTGRIKTFVDKWIAHHDADQRRFGVPVFTHVGEALQDIDEIYCEYALLLTGAGMTSQKPVLQYDWKKPLRYPWIGTGDQGGQ
ncbi:MAG: hypothetical protein ABFE13_00800 [Phycisphaerales bacterium]